MSTSPAWPRVTPPSKQAIVTGPWRQRPARRVLPALALAALCILPAAAAAPLDPVLAARGWQELRFDDKTPNRYEALSGNGLRLVSDSSVSMIYRPATANLERTPLLRWRWRVLSVGPATDLAVKGADDRPIALYVGFPYEPDRAGLWERMRRPLVELKKGASAPGKVLVYVWGGTQPRGTRFDSPYMGTASGNMVLRPGDAATGGWVAESVDLAADFKMVFGYPAPAPVQIAISGDSDDSNSRSVAEITDIVFAARP